jgi:hypothetical protein
MSGVLMLMLWAQVGCGTAPGDPPPPQRYSQPAQVIGMPPCRATVESLRPCDAGLRTDDGALLYLGSPAASITVVRFVRTLQVGQTCTLPQDFIRFSESEAAKEHP